MYAATTQSGYIDRQVDFDYSSYYNNNYQQQQNDSQGHYFPENYNNYNTQAGGYYGTNSHYNVQQQVDQVQNNTYQYPAPTSEVRTSDGRCPHTVVAFGFGGTFSVIKPCPQQSFYRETSSLIEVYSLNTAVPPEAGLEINPAETKSKSEALKWISDRKDNCFREEATSSQALPLLWGALKIAFEHHGKIRTPAMEGNGPEAALGQMILSASTSASASHDCLQQVPTEETMQKTAMKVNGLLLCGKFQQALQCAEDGKLWGTALVLASQLGDTFYSNTVSKMAYEQLAPGPLRTLSLIMGGQSAQILTPTDNSTQESLLDNWHETLALLATNKSMGVESVLVHLGDSLWTEQGEVAAAHLCYILVDQNSETFFDDGRISLVGADHWRQPRTFVTPLAIKRTELYEHLKRINNPQFVLMNFQPYKIVLAYALAEAGHLAEALRCCQAVSKTLKSKNFSHMETARKAANDLEQRLSGSLDGKGSLTGRIISSTFSFVRGSLPAAPRLTRYNSSTAIKETTENVKTPTRCVSEPDFSRSDPSAPVPNAGILRRISSSVYQKAAGMVSSKQPNLGETDFQARLPEEQPDMVVSTTDYGMPPLPRKPNGLYVQCSDYYSRCMSTFSKDGRFVQALPSVSFKFMSSAPSPRRLEV